jgi:hypothetical protein
LTLRRYNHKRGLWTSFDVSHMIKLHDNNSTIFLKDLLVTHCVDLERHLQQSHSSPVPNLFTNLADECRAVKAVQKSHTGRTPFRNDDVLELSSTDEADEPPVPVVSHSELYKPMSCSPSVVQWSPSPPEGDFQWPLSPVHPNSSMSLHPNSSMSAVQDTKSSESSAFSAPSSLSSDEDDRPTVCAHKCPRPRSLSPGTFSDPIDVDEQRIWPVDFYACDIEAGFQKCTSATRAQHSIPATFTKHFGICFIKTTYYDHWRHWMEEVDAQVQEHYISYGRTSKGLWSSFLQEIHKK